MIRQHQFRQASVMRKFLNWVYPITPDGNKVDNLRSGTEVSGFNVTVLLFITRDRSTEDT